MKEKIQNKQKKQNKNKNTTVNSKSGNRPDENTSGDRDVKNNTLTASLEANASTRACIAVAEATLRMLHPTLYRCWWWRGFCNDGSSLLRHTASTLASVAVSDGNANSKMRLPGHTCTYTGSWLRSRKSCASSDDASTTAENGRRRGLG